MVFEFNEVMSFAKEYIKGKNIPIDKILISGLRIRISNPDWKDVNSIAICREAFFVDGDSICSEVCCFCWSGGMIDLRIYSPDEYKLPDCKDFLYTEEPENGYYSKEDWVFFQYKKNLTPDDDLLFSHIFMEGDTLCISDYYFLDFKKRVLSDSDPVTSVVTDLMTLTDKPIKDIYILHKPVEPRYHLFDDGEIRIVI